MGRPKRVARVKIGVVADVHQGPLDVRRWLRAFVDDMNEGFRPDFVVELGDFIGCGEGAEAELRRIDEVYSQCEAPRYYVVGNHDLQGLTREQFMRVVGVESTWSSFDVGFLHVVLLDGAWGPDTDSGGPTGHIPSEELDWLQEDLEQVPPGRPIVAFCHYPIKLFRDEPRIDNEDELWEVFRGHNLIATFSGDAHYGGYREVEGVHNVCLHSMGWWELDKITGSYAKIIVEPGRLVVQGVGAQPSYYLRTKKWTP
ncbi:MAG: hypothetical protein DRJ56_08375 [Thermoprotei archaeon]|nr:MAG: hypothetical protein DRJ56_08375 [Thermoprotei archaeon]